MKKISYILSTCSHVHSLILSYTIERIHRRKRMSYHSTSTDQQSESHVFELHVQLMMQLSGSKGLRSSTHLALPLVVHKLLLQAQASSPPVFLLSEHPTVLASLTSQYLHHIFVSWPLGASVATLAPVCLLSRTPFHTINTSTTWMAYAVLPSSAAT